MTIDSTVAKMGRSMKKCEIMTNRPRCLAAGMSLGASFLRSSLFVGLGGLLFAFP
jgi:hypothetical protein